MKTLFKLGQLVEFVRGDKAKDIPAEFGTIGGILVTTEGHKYQVSVVTGEALVEQTQIIRSYKVDKDMSKPRPRVVKIRAPRAPKDLKDSAPKESQVTQEVCR